MRIRLNGAERELEPGTSVAALVRQLALAPEEVAVEVNGELVPRRLHAERALAEGDSVELVTLVGGG